MLFYSILDVFSECACVSLYFVMWPRNQYFANHFPPTTTGKARRLKQAKDEATEEIEKYRQEREKQFKEFEAKVCPMTSILNKNIVKLCVWL